LTTEQNLTKTISVENAISFSHYKPKKFVEIINLQKNLQDINETKFIDPLKKNGYEP